MDTAEIINNLKEDYSCLKKYEAESKELKEKVAKADSAIAQLNKEAEALKIAMDMVLDEVAKKEVFDKFATLKNEDLTVVKKALDLDLTKKTASLGDLYDSDTRVSVSDPVKAFMSVFNSKNDFSVLQHH